MRSAIKSVRNKYNLIKSGVFEQSRSAEAQLKPLIEPIKLLIDRIKKEEGEENLHIKRENLKTLKREKKEKDEVEEESTSRKVSRILSRDFQTPTAASTPSAPRIKTLPEIYLHEKPMNELDLVYGVKHDEKKGVYTMGNKEIGFLQNSNDFVVDTHRVPRATRGLYELIFMKHPGPHTENDKAIYKLILKTTGAHLNSNGKIKSNSGYKYKNIIKPLFANKKASTEGTAAEEEEEYEDEDEAERAEGKGIFLKVNRSKPKEYIY